MYNTDKLQIVCNVNKNVIDMSNNSMVRNLIPYEQIKKHIELTRQLSDIKKYQPKYVFLPYINYDQK